MAELMTTLADQIAAPADAPSAALRIGTITAIEVGGSGRVQTDSTLGAWLSRDADSLLSVGDRVWILQQGTVWLVCGRVGVGTGVPVGSLTPYAGSSSSMPPGWLSCDGSAVSRTAYAALFAAIGTTYGNGNGSTTFNLPNLVNRVPVGSGGDYGRGSTGGASTVTLSIAQMPSHNHGGAGDHTHSGALGGGRATVQSGTGITVSNAGAVESGEAGWHTHSSQGSGAAHENMPPYVAMPWIIRAL